MSQVERSLSPLPTDLLYSTVPQHRLQNYMQSFGGSDSGDETQESLKATSSQGDDSDSHSTGTNSDDEEEQEEQYSCLDSFKFELSAPGIKMPSLSFLVPDSKLQANDPQLFQRSCAGLADAPSRLGDGCAMLSERASLHEKVQGDTECELVRSPSRRTLDTARGRQLFFLCRYGPLCTKRWILFYWLPWLWRPAH